MRRWDEKSQRVNVIHISLLVSLSPSSLIHPLFSSFSSSIFLGEKYERKEQDSGAGRKEVSKRGRQRRWKESKEEEEVSRETPRSFIIFSLPPSFSIFFHFLSLSLSFLFLSPFYSFRLLCKDIKSECRKMRWVPEGGKEEKNGERDEGVK